MAVYYLLTNMSSPRDLRLVGTKNIFFCKTGSIHFQFMNSSNHHAFVLIDAEELILLHAAGEPVLLDAEDLVLLDAGEPVLFDAEDLVLLDRGEPVLHDSEDLPNLDAREPILLNIDLILLDAGDFRLPVRNGN